jgi:uncharacterized integral membrane protein
LYRIGFIILALAAIALGLVVGTLNSEAVNVDLLWIQIQWPLGLVMLLALVVGLAVGIAMTWLTTVLPTRMQLKKQKGNPGRPPSGGNDA